MPSIPSMEISIQDDFKHLDIRGKGYDGASNMRGEWNGLQALFLKDIPYAYYIHCARHQMDHITGIQALRHFLKTATAWGAVYWAAP
ncbi:repressor of the inhibitor of the protein kinase-like protein [Trifolium pratense]|uniref:Repressor of the inhibitor of the protein kinase-like protein n=1 Tax=Trifolium pratense TaxID=57577 RepID=A0A2K3N185_TRIPR|nr:repressor of the inhibitor of the protein kinase-like protein [Trifolium pratense]